MELAIAPWQEAFLGWICGTPLGTLWHSWAKVCEPIELPFGVVSGVGPSIGVLDGGPLAQGKGRFFVGGMDEFSGHSCIEAKHYHSIIFAR